MTPLFAQKQSGERTFERLYKAHVQDVYRYALMVLRNTADAEDVAQTTFLKAYRAFQRGERPRHPRQWLITIAHNTCRSHLRDGKRRPQEVELEEQVTSSVQLPADDAIDPHELVRALGSLSFNQRAALVMRELEGRSYSEIADVLQVSSSAVETLLFRARRALREQLEGSLSCGEAEYALSLQLDGRLPSAEKGKLRAHLRECKECATVARRQRARQAVLRGLGPLPLPASLASWGGGTVGIGLGAKAAAVLVAGLAAAGTGIKAAEAVSEPAAHDRSAETTVAVERTSSHLLVERRERVVPVARVVAPARAAAKKRASKAAETATPTHVGHVTTPAAVSAPASASASASALAPAPAPAAAVSADTPAPAAAVTVAVPKLPVEVPVKTPVAVPTPPPVSVAVSPPPAVPAPPPLPPTPTVPLPDAPQLPSLP